MTGAGPNQNTRGMSVCVCVSVCLSVCVTGAGPDENTRYVCLFVLSDCV